MMRRVAFWVVFASALVWLTWLLAWRQATSLLLESHDFDVDADVGKLAEKSPPSPPPSAFFGELAEKSPPPSGFFGVQWKSVEELANWLVKKEG
eukprot:6010334-Amphidinium_carterae.1